MKTMVIIIAAAMALLVSARPAGAVVLQGDFQQPSGRFGDAASELEDLNGDGRWEFLIGAPQVDGTGANDGRVYLWFGGATLTASANLVLSGDYNEQFGFAVARVGDVNHDGRPDFAVGAPRYSQGGLNRGRVYLYFGGPTLDAEPDAILECPTGGSEPMFGSAVSAADDFNGDGIDDLLVGAPDDDTPGTDAGTVFVYYGSANLAQLQSVDLTLHGESPYDHFGWSVTDAGNFFRDGTAAVAIGAPANDNAVTNEGRVFVFRGSTGPTPGPDATSDLTLTSSTGATRARNWFGYAVRGVGDWDNDGDDDLAVGAPRDDTRGIDAGRVEIFLGADPPASAAGRYANGDDAEDLFGWALADLGEATGDSRTDLLIGAPGVNVPAAGAGQAYVFAGGGASASSPAGLYRTLLAQGVNPDTQAGDAFGACVASAGDLDGDGVRDWAVCAPTGNVANNAVSGYVRLYDSGGALVPTLLRSWSAAWSDAGEARLTFTLAEPPAAFQALALWRDITPHGGPTTRTLACSGPLLDGALPLSFTGDQWVLRDHPGVQADGSSLKYALVLTRAAGLETTVDELAGPPPANTLAFELQPPRPNPFNPRTAVLFRAPVGELVTCRVFDLQGRFVATLHDGTATGFWQTAVWDGRCGGHPAPAGVYAVRLAAGGRVCTRLVVLAK